MQQDTEPFTSENLAQIEQTDGTNRLHLALFISGLSVGGVQRSMLSLAHGLAARGHRVDLIVPKANGFFRPQVSPLVRLVDIEHWWMRLPLVGWWKRTRALVSPPALARYLQREQPDVLLSASHYVNLAAIWGRRLAGTDTPLVISQRTHLSRAVQNADFPGGKRPLLGWMARRFYPEAEAIIAVSDGVADDLAGLTSLPRERIQTIYNPVFTTELINKSLEAVEHPWFAPGAPPVILGVGRLAAQKDFPTLLRAFARVRASRPARLMILGEGRKRRELESLAASLRISQDLALPGFDENPFRYMAHAGLFVLSSEYEGLPGVLIQALACGCPVVSTDCPSGPREVLESGCYGPLVPVGDDARMAQAILSVLDEPPDREKLITRAAAFSLDRAVEQYLDVLQRVCAKQCIHHVSCRQ